MQISDESLNEFIAIYEDEFKEKISRADALALAGDLIALYELLSRNLPNRIGSFFCRLIPR
jgi:hypothetical protein